MKSEQQSDPDMQPALENIGTDKFLIGRIEEIRLSPPSRIFHARIDTGANTSSLDVRDIQTVERDGKPWVRFEIKTGLSLAWLRPTELQIPFQPGPKKAVWLIEARIDFKASGEPVRVSLNLPDTP